MNQQNIEGLPPGTKIKRVNLDPTKADRFGGFIELETANVYGLIDLREAKIPEGYERAGDTPEEWFRTFEWGVNIPDMDLFYLDYVDNAVLPCRSGVIFHKNSTEDRRRIILCKVKRTRRVLVAEWDMHVSPMDVLEHPVPDFDNPDARAWAVAKPSRHCIEEREWKIQGDENMTRLCEEHIWVSVNFAEDCCATCGLKRPHSQEGPIRAAEPTLNEFRMFCEKHPDLRFWQALAAWSGAKDIEYVPYSNGECPRVPNRDTFTWKGRNG